MAIGSDSVKIALKENGEVKFLKNISVEDGVSYELTEKEEADTFVAEGVAPTMKALHDNEPDKKFILVV